MNVFVWTRKYSIHTTRGRGNSWVLSLSLYIFKTKEAAKFIKKIYLVLEKLLAI